MTTELRTAEAAEQAVWPNLTRAAAMFGVSVATMSRWAEEADRGTWLRGEKCLRPRDLLALAERQDAHAAHSAECVRLLKRCQHLFSLVLGGKGELFYDAPGGAQEARARDVYEFRSAPRQSGRRQGGTLLLQDPPGDV